jgi:hypothetical protein
VQFFPAGVDGVSGDGCVSNLAPRFAGDIVECQDPAKRMSSAENKGLCQNVVQAVRAAKSSALHRLADDFCKCRDKVLYPPHGKALRTAKSYVLL